MRDLQELFNELEAIKQEQRTIRKDYRDMLANDGEYQQRKEDYEAARRAKKEVELATQSAMGGAYERLEELANERKALEEMISDVAMTQLMRGESIEISDKDHNTYTPVYKVRFKKVD